MKRLNRRKALPYTLALAASGIVGAAGLAYAAGIEPRWVEVVRLRVEMPRLASQFDGYRIVQISDLHMGEWMTPSQLRDAIEMVNSEEPDLIAITGDYVTRVYDNLVADLVPVLNGLHARDGVAWVLGNHDYWGGKGAGPVRYALGHCGMIDLNNRVHTLERDGAQLHIAGVELGARTYVTPRQGAGSTA